MSRNAMNIVQVLSPTDATLLSFLDQVLELEGFHRATIVTSPGQNDVVTSADEFQAFKDELSGNGSLRLIHRLVIQSGQNPTNRNAMSIDFDRGVSAPMSNNTLDLRPSLTVAEFHFRNPQHHPDFAKAVHTLIATAFSRDVPIGDTAEDTPSFAAAITQMTSVAGSISTTLATSAADQQARMDTALATLDQRRIALEEEFAQRQSDADAAIAGRNQTLDTREAELENDTARSEQRKLREKITSNVKTSLKDGITDAQSIIEAALLVAVSLMAVGGLFYFGIYSFTKTAELASLEGRTLSGFDWTLAALLVRASLAFFGGLFILFWLLRFLRARVDDARRRQLSLERYSLDIDRASWVIETALAMKDEEGLTSIPDPWLEGATRSLFELPGTERGGNEVDPMVALSELLSTGASLKVGNGTSELNITPKASRKIARKSNTGE